MRRDKVRSTSCVIYSCVWQGVGVRVNLVCWARHGKVHCVSLVCALLDLSLLTHLSDSDFGISLPLCMPVSFFQ